MVQVGIGGNVRMGGNIRMGGAIRQGDARQAKRSDKQPDHQLLHFHVLLVFWGTPVRRADRRKGPGRAKIFSKKEAYP